MQLWLGISYYPTHHLPFFYETSKVIINFERKCCLIWKWPPWNLQIIKPKWEFKWANVCELPKILHHPSSLPIPLPTQNAFYLIRIILEGFTKRNVCLLKAPPHPPTPSTNTHLSFVINTGGSHDLEYSQGAGGKNEYLDDRWLQMWTLLKSKSYP